jgi:flavin reductase (DIM6/NTAB) family NADH-FMN oxidoreductase RutF
MKQIAVVPHTAGRPDCRDLRAALGEFATGVTVITTRSPHGNQVGVTANSFASVSLDPPLVLWCCSRQAPSAPVFRSARRFAVNVLAANQHHLSRQFATPADDKFADVACTYGPDGTPLIDGAIARFVCRAVSVHDGGDHLIQVGEVEDYQRFGGEPLIFHSGQYRLPFRQTCPFMSGSHS